MLPGPDRKYLSEALDAFYGDRVRQLTGLAAISPSFVSDVLCNETMLAVCDRVLGPSCANYQLNVAQAMDRGPGAEQQYFHRDEDVWIHMPHPRPVLQIASVMALVDFTAENGATRLVPGSHEWPRDRQPSDDEIVVAEMPAGSAIVYLGSVIHGGGANCTENQWRRGMHLSYVVGWLRTEENHYLSIPPSIARDLPEKAQELLGYAVHDAIAEAGGYLGAVDLLDPMQLLREGRL